MKTYSLVYFAALLSLGMLLLQNFQAELLYVRKPILAGEVWRLFSAQFVHLDYKHLALNAVGFCLLAAVLHDIFPLKFLIFSIFINALFVSGGLFLFHPEIQWYAGFSGILYGLYLSGGIFMVLARHYAGGSLLIIALLAKTLLDGWMPDIAVNLQTISSPVIDEAHRYGMLAAFLTGLHKIYAHLRQTIKH